MEFRRRVASLLSTSARSRVFSLPNLVSRQIPIRARGALGSARRAYATPGRPRKAVGESSRPAKKRTTTKSTATKKKATKSKKAKKPAAKKRARKPLTDKQIEARAAKKNREDVKHLKTAALLDAPRVLRTGPYSIFNAERSRGLPLGHDTSRSVAAQYKSLSQLEKQHYITLAAEQKEQKLAALQRFLDEHTPEQIRQANSARLSLRKKFPKLKSRYRAIQDERAVKRPKSSYIYFALDQYTNNDDDGNRPAMVSQAGEIKTAWDALGTAEKQKYTDLAAQDQARYAKEYTSVYGHSPPQKRPNSKTVSP